MQKLDFQFLGLSTTLSCGQICRFQSAPCFHFLVSLDIGSAVRGSCGQWAEGRCAEEITGGPNASINIRTRKEPTPLLLALFSSAERQQKAALPQLRSRGFTDLWVIGSGGQFSRGPSSPPPHRAQGSQVLFITNVCFLIWTQGMLISVLLT